MHNNTPLSRLLSVVMLFLVASGGCSSLAQRPAANEDLLEKQTPARTVVSILWFENRAGADAEHWRYGLEGFLSRAMKEVKAIRLRKGVGYARRMLGIEDGSVLTMEQARKIGEIVEAQRVIWGSYQGSSNSWQVTVSLLNVASGEISDPITATGTDWFDIRDALAQQILNVLEVIPSEEENQELLRRTTDSSQALEWYCKTYAYQAEGRPLSVQEECATKAIKADPNYAEAHAALAAIHASKGEFAEAKASLRRALEIKPDHASAHQILGILHLIEKRNTQGLSELKEALRLDPDDAETLSRLSEFYSVQKEWDEAMTYMEEAVAMAPMDASLHAQLGWMWVQSHDRDRAMRELKEAERLADPDAPGYLNAEQRLSQAYRQLGEIPLAIEHYEELLTRAKKQGFNPELFNQFNDTLQHLKATLTPTFVEAKMPRVYTEQTLQKALQERLTPAELDVVINPVASNPDIRRWALQLTADTTNEIDRARAIFDGLLHRIQPKGGRGMRTAQEVFAAWEDSSESFSCQEFAKLYLALAREVGLKVFYVHLGRDYQGKLVFHDCAILFTGDKALLVDPAYRWFGVPHQEFTVLDDLQTVAHQLFQHTPWEDNVEKCRVAAKLHPDFAWGQVSLASALLKDDEPGEANKALENAERLEPGSWDIYRLRGRMAVKYEDWDKAMVYLTKAKELNPEDAEIYFLLGTALQAQGKEEEAREAYRTCLRNGPGDMLADQVRRGIVQINERIGVESGEEFATAEFLVAVEQGKTETVRQMLAEGVDADTREASGATALMVAAQQGHVDIVRLMLEHGADINHRDNTRGYTALMVAAQEGNLDVAGVLLSAGADANIARNDGQTAMHAAADPGYVQVLKLLIEEGADVNASSSMGLTPLLLASQKGHAEAARVLIEAGADVEAAETTIGATPLFIASQNGHAETVKMLLAAKVNVNEVTSNGMTALHIATIKNHPEVVELLLHAGADKRTLATNPYGGKYTALELARQYGYEEIVELLQ